MVTVDHAKLFKQEQLSEQDFQDSIDQSESSLLQVESVIVNIDETPNEPRPKKIKNRAGYR